MKIYLTTSKWALLCVASTAFSPVPSLVRPSRSSSYKASPWDDLEQPATDAAKSLTSSLMTSEDMGSSIVNNAPLLLVPALSFVLGQAVLKSREKIQKNVVQTEMLLNRLKNGPSRTNPKEVEKTERDLTKLKSQLKSADSLITASFTGASVSSAVSLCVMMGAVDAPQFSLPSFGGDYSPPTMLAGQTPQPKVLTIESPKQAAAVEDASPYNALLSSSSSSSTKSEPAVAAKDYDVVALPMTESSNELQQQESSTAVAKLEAKGDDVVVEIPKSNDIKEQTPSFMDTLMTKVEAALEKSAEDEVAAAEAAAKQSSFVDSLMTKLETDNDQQAESSSDALLSKTEEPSAVAEEPSADTAADATDRMLAKIFNPEPTTDAANLDIVEPESTITTESSSSFEQRLLAEESETSMPTTTESSSSDEQQLLAKQSEGSLEAIAKEEAALLEEPRYEVIPQQQTEEERMTTTAKGAEVDKDEDASSQELMDDSKLLAEENNVEPTVDEQPLKSPPAPPAMTLLETYGDQVLL